MFAKVALLACLANPAEAGVVSRETAIELHKGGHFAAAGEHMAEVYSRATTPDERRAAALFVVGAFKDAFAQDPVVAAALACRGLAIADDFLAHEEGPGAARVRAGRARLAALREPFGPCDAPAEPAADLLPVSARAASPPRSQPGRPVELDPQPSPAAVRPRRTMFWSGVGVAVLGATTTAVALGLGLSRARAAADGADGLTAGAAGRAFTGPELAQLDGLREQLREGRMIVGVGVGAGAAMMVAGAVLAVFGRVRGDAQRAAVGPWRGVSVTLRF